MTAEERLRIDDNLVLDDRGCLRCAHCGTVANEPDEPFLARAVLVEADPGAAGPQVRGNAAAFVDPKVVYRQRVCSRCAVAFQTEVVPADDPPMRTKELSG